MKTLCVALLAVTVILPLGAQMKIVSVIGDVSVRRGAEENWVTAAAGDVLKPEDSMRMGEKSGAAVKIGDGSTIGLPAMTIVDMADLRNITQQELLLKLAMEDVRSAPGPAPGTGEYDVPRTTTTRAGDKDDTSGITRPARRGSLLRLNGTAVLYDNGFYGSCVLTSREIYRLDPSLLSDTGSRLRVADALVRMKLNGEALDYYRAIAAGENLTREEKVLVGKKIETLKEIVSPR